jgi:hypothetical protein
MLPLLGRLRLVVVDQQLEIIGFAFAQFEYGSEPVGE